MAANILQHLVEGGAAIVWTVGVAHKLHLHASLLKDKLFAAQAFAQTSQRNHLQKFLSLVRYRSEAVDESLTVSVELAVVANVV